MWLGEREFIGPKAITLEPRDQYAGLADMLYDEDSDVPKAATGAWFRTLAAEQRFRLLWAHQLELRLHKPELFERKPYDWTDNWVILRRDGTKEYGPGTRERRGDG